MYTEQIPYFAEEASFRVSEALQHLKNIRDRDLGDYWDLNKEKEIMHAEMFRSVILFTRVDGVFNIIMNSDFVK